MTSIEISTLIAATETKYKISTNREVLRQMIAKGTQWIEAQVSALKSAPDSAAKATLLNTARVAWEVARAIETQP